MGNLFAKLQQFSISDTESLSSNSNHNTAPMSIITKHQDKLQIVKREILHLENLECDSDLEQELEQTCDVDNVRYLKVIGTSVQNIPITIGRYGNLVCLDLSGNYIQELPWAIVYLKSLKVLDLSNNMLTHIPKTVVYLRALTVLDLSYNFITHLPTELLYLRNLEELSLDGNKDLISPPSDVVRKGITDIMNSLAARYNRQDLWKDWLDVASQKKIMATLFQLCISCILHNKVEFITPSYIPPVIKSHLSDCVKEQEKLILVCKCSVCFRYFSNKFHFDIHHCKK